MRGFCAYDFEGVLADSVADRELADADVLEVELVDGHVDEAHENVHHLHDKRVVTYL